MESSHQLEGMLVEEGQQGHWEVGVEGEQQQKLGQVEALEYSSLEVGALQNLLLVEEVVRPLVVVVLQNLWRWVEGEGPQKHWSSMEGEGVNHLGLVAERQNQWR